MVTKRLLVGSKCCHFARDDDSVFDPNRLAVASSLESICAEKLSGRLGSKAVGVENYQIKRSGWQLAHDSREPLERQNCYTAPRGEDEYHAAANLGEVNILKAINDSQPLHRERAVLLHHRANVELDWHKWECRLTLRFTDAAPMTSEWNRGAIAASE